MSFLDLAYVELGIDPIAGLQIIDAQDFAEIASAVQHPLMITQVYSQMVASDLKIALMDVLLDEYEKFISCVIWVCLMRNAVRLSCSRSWTDSRISTILQTLIFRRWLREQRIPYLKRLTMRKLLPGIITFGKDEDEFAEEGEEEGYAEDFCRKQALMISTSSPWLMLCVPCASPGGCLGTESRHTNLLRSNRSREVYEYLEAVDADDVDGMREELGDVLMQVVFHARMAQEAGRFDLQDVIDEVVDKLIRRHPHVFGDTHVDNSDDVLVNWEAIKKQEKQERKHVLDGVSQGLPALLRAYKLQSKAAKVGFDWQDSASVWAKVQEELGELQEALQAGDKAAAESELGDVLFAVVNYARHNGIEPEVALDGTNNRFASRFNYVEKQVEASGKTWQDFTLNELDEFWNQAKELERKSDL